MPNGEKTLLEHWQIANKYYPSLRNVPNPIDEATGGFTDEAKEAWRNRSTTPPAAPTQAAPFMPQATTPFDPIVGDISSTFTPTMVPPSVSPEQGPGVLGSIGEVLEAGPPWARLAPKIAPLAFKPLEAIHEYAVKPTVSGRTKYFPMKYEDDKWKPTFDAYLKPEGGIDPMAVLGAFAGADPVTEAFNWPALGQRTIMAKNVREEAERREAATGKLLNERERRKIREEQYKMPPYVRGMLEELPWFLIPPAKAIRGGLQARKAATKTPSFQRYLMGATREALTPLEVYEQGIAKTLGSAGRNVLGLPPTPKGLVPIGTRPVAPKPPPPTAMREEGFSELPGMSGFSIYVDDVIKYRGRDMVVVRLPDGKFQPFYRRTGRGGEAKHLGPEQWAPFDGVVDESPIPGVYKKGWVNKAAYVGEGREDVLFRLGTVENRRISNALKQVEESLPEPKDVESPREVNEWLGVSGKLEEQGPGIGKGPTARPTRQAQQQPLLGEVGTDITGYNLQTGPNYGSLSLRQAVRIGDDVVFEAADGTMGAGKVTGKGTIEINEVRKPYFNIRTATGEAVRKPAEAVRLADVPTARVVPATDVVPTTPAPSAPKSLGVLTDQEFQKLEGLYKDRDAIGEADAATHLKAAIGRLKPSALKGPATKEDIREVIKKVSESWSRTAAYYPDMRLGSKEAEKIIGDIYNNLAWKRYNRAKSSVERHRLVDELSISEVPNNHPLARQTRAIFQDIMEETPSTERVSASYQQSQNIVDDYETELIRKYGEDEYFEALNARARASAWDDVPDPPTERVVQEVIPPTRAGATIAGGRFKHFTTPEVKARLEAGETFDPTRVPKHGTGDLGRGPKVGKFAGNRLYLSLDDERWSKIHEESIKGKVVPSTPENEGMGGTSFFDYDKQQWMKSMDEDVVTTLSPVEFEISPISRVLELGSMSDYDRVKDKYGYLLEEVITTGELSVWDRIARDYDVVAIRNSDEIVKATDNKFFRAVGGDQVIVLNPRVARVYTPTTPTAERVVPATDPPIATRPTVREVIDTPAAIPKELPKVIPTTGGAGIPPTSPPTRPTGGYKPLADIPEGSRFLADLREITDVAREVRSITTPVIRQIAQFFVNPSAAMDTETGKILVAYYRQQIAIDSAVEVGLAGGLGGHVRGMRPFMRGREATGRVVPKMLGALSKTIAWEPVRINSQGFFANTKYLWNDVFSRPDDPRWASELLPEEKAYIKDYLTLVDEAEAIRIRRGLAPRGTRSKDGWFYVPRQVESIDNLELLGKTNPKLRRVFEEATVGYFDMGIRYSNSPYRTLELHLRASYKEILDKQLSDALAPLSIKPSRLISTDITNDAIEKTRELTKARREVNRLRVPRGRLRKGMPSTEAERTLRKELTTQRRNATARKNKAESAYTLSKNRYNNALDDAKAKQYAPGELFGKADKAIVIGEWNKRFMPKEDADLLKEALQSTPRRGVRSGGDVARWSGRGFVNFVNITRMMSATLDYAAPLIHGLFVLTENPVIWAKATGYHYRAFLDPTVYSRYVRDNLDSFAEMSAAGIPTGMSNEMFIAMQAGRGASPLALLGKVPGGEGARRAAKVLEKQSLGRFQASYSAMLGVSRNMLWKANKDSWDGSDAELAAYIRNLTGGLDTRALGVGPAQQSVESVMLAFSPRLLRSTVAVTADALRGLVNMVPGRAITARQAASLRNITRLLIGAGMVYTLAGIALGKPWKDIEKGLNPLSGKKHMAYLINNDWIGAGGQQRALLQFLSYAIAATYKGDINKFLTPNMMDNPILQLYMSRGAVGVNVLGAIGEGLSKGKINILPYDHIDSVPDIAKHLGTSLLPFVVQGKLDGEGAIAQAASQAGFRTSVMTEGERMERLGREEVPEMFEGKTVEEINRIRGYESGIWSEKDLDYTPEESWSKDPKTQALVKGAPGYAEASRKKREDTIKFNPALGRYYAQVDEYWNTLLKKLEEAWKASNNDKEEPGRHYREKRTAIFAEFYLLKEQAKKIAAENKAFRDMDPDGPYDEASDVYNRLLFADDGSSGYSEWATALLGSYDDTYVYTPLEDEYGINWDEREYRREYLKKQYSPQFVEDIKALHEASPDKPLPDYELQLRRDREYIEATGYWNVERILAEDLGVEDAYDTYKSLLRQNKPAEAKDYIRTKGPSDLIYVVGGRSRAQKGMRNKDPYLKGLIEKYGYY